jgi:uncharacterized C2H2 Zn-finger protein
MANADVAQGIRAVFPSCPLCRCEPLQVQTSHESFDDTDIDYVKGRHRTTILRCPRCHAVWSIDQTRRTAHATLQATDVRPLDRSVIVGRRMPVRYWRRIRDREPVEP